MSDLVCDSTISLGDALKKIGALVSLNNELSDASVKTVFDSSMISQAMLRHFMVSFSVISKTPEKKSLFVSYPMVLYNRGSTKSFSDPTVILSEETYVSCTAGDFASCILLHKMPTAVWRMDSSLISDSLCDISCSSES